MAELQQKESKDGKKGKQKKVHLRVDFTPMVDMNMLLITFFMLATTMIKPQTMEISMPTKDKVPESEQTKVKESLAVTLLLGKDSKVYYFFGKPDFTKQNFLQVTDFSPKGLREILLNKNRTVVMQINQLKEKKLNRQITKAQFDEQVKKLKDGKLTPVVIIKASDGAVYSDLVNALDEMQICSIGKYAIVEFDAGDKTLFKNSNIAL